MAPQLDPEDTLKKHYSQPLTLKQQVVCWLISSLDGAGGRWHADITVSIF